MSKILLLSTPINTGNPGLALRDEPSSIHVSMSLDEKVAKIKALSDQFWKSVGGIIWNPQIKVMPYNGKLGNSVKLSNDKIPSFINAQNFPTSWTLSQREEYINQQASDIINYTRLRLLWLPSDSKGWTDFRKN